MAPWLLCASLFRCKAFFVGRPWPRSALKKGRGVHVVRRAMFERFSPGSMKAVMLAQAESRSLGHNYVGAEMLVLGILAEGNERGCQALEAAGITLSEAKTKLREMVGVGMGAKEAPGAPETLVHVAFRACHMVFLMLLLDANCVQNVEIPMTKEAVKAGRLS